MKSYCNDFYLFIPTIMETTALVSTKKNQLYSKLVTDFIKNENLKVSESEKTKFLMLCMVNELNPRKKEVYAIPYGDKLTLVISYNVYLQRAERTWLLSGWNIRMDKKDGKLFSGKITIYRKDRKEPFEYELEMADAKNDRNPLRNTKPEDMLRKQLIRIGFSLAFPESAPISDPEEVTEDQFYIKAQEEGVEIVDLDKSQPKKDFDYQSFIDYLLSFLPDEFTLEGFGTCIAGDAEQADMIIIGLQREIYKRFVKESTILLDKEDIKKIFIGSDEWIQKAMKEALALAKKQEKKDE